MHDQREERKKEKLIIIYLKKKCKYFVLNGIKFIIMYNLAIKYWKLGRASTFIRTYLGCCTFEITNGLIGD